MIEKYKCYQFLAVNNNLNSEIHMQTVATRAQNHRSPKEE